MKRDVISMRQLLVLIVTGLMAATLRLVPARSAASAGGPAAWLAPAAALPAALALCLLLGALFKGVPRDWGLGEVLAGTLGPVLGRCATLLYIVWMALILGTGISQCGERLGALGYSVTGRWVFLAAALALTAAMALGKLSSFARAAEVFFLILTGALVLVTALALFRVEPGNLAPLEGNVLLGALPTVEAVCAGVPAAFLLGLVPPGGGRKKKVALWLAAGAVILTGVHVACIGAFGWQVTALQTVPLYEAAKQVGVPGAFHRVEAVVAALLVMSDVTLFALAFFTLREMGRSVYRKLSPKIAVPVSAAVGCAVAFWFQNWAEVQEILGRFVLPAMSLLLGFALPAFVLIVKTIRKRGKHGGTSCGEDGG